MKSKWEWVALNRILQRSNFLETPISDKRYRQIGIQLWGRGIYQREEIDGKDTSYSYFNKVQTGDVVINKIWARNGAVAVVEDQYDGSYVSTEFPVFTTDKDLCNPNWISLATKQKWFWLACNEKAFGTSGKNRIRPEKFLEIEIPLPSISEQERIVRDIQSIKLKSDEIRTLRKEQQKEIKNLVYSKYCETIENVSWVNMLEIAPIIRREVEIEENKWYPELGIRSFGKGTFHKPPLSSFDVGTKTLYQIKAGDLLFSNVFAWEGGIAVAKENDSNRYGSHRFISCEVNPAIAVADFLCYHFLTPKGLEDINKASPGGAGRNKTLGLNKLMNIKVPLPLKEKQEEFAGFKHKLEIVSGHHSASLKELDELFPSLLDKAFKGEL
jgi:type I restriction enzyme, S subunit